MPLIQTAKDLGVAIRSRRMELGWDQATLARQVGVTRQWVIDIEKGKPRAELALALRALRVLGLSLNVDEKPEGRTEPGNETGGRHTSGATPSLDINAIVERHRLGGASHSAASLGVMPDYLRQRVAAGRLEHVANSVAATTVADILGDSAASRLSGMVNPKLPKTAAEYLKEMGAERHPESMAGFDAARSAADAIGGDTLTRQLSELAHPTLPETAADYLKEMRAAGHLDSLSSLDAIRRSINPLSEAISASRLADPAFTGSRKR